MSRIENAYNLISNAVKNVDYLLNNKYNQEVFNALRSNVGQALLSTNEWYVFDVPVIVQRIVTQRERVFKLTRTEKAAAKPVVKPKQVIGRPILPSKISAKISPLYNNDSLILGKKVIIVSGQTWSATNTTSTFLHLHNDVFSFAHPYNILNKKIRDDWEGQKVWSIDKAYSEFVDFSNKKNNTHYSKYPILSVRENDFLLEVYKIFNKLSKPDAYKNTTYLIATHRDPYETFWAFFWKGVSVDSDYKTIHDRVVKPTITMANNLISKFNMMLDVYEKIKIMGYKLIIVDLVCRNPKQYDKILDFVNITKSDLQTKWINTMPYTNSTTGKGMHKSKKMNNYTDKNKVDRDLYLFYRDKYKNKFSHLFDSIRNHKLLRNIYE